MRRRRMYPIELKRLAVSRVLAGEPVSAVALEEDIGLSRLYEWIALARQGRLAPVRGRGRPPKEEVLRRAASDGALVDQETAAQRRIARLERKIAQQELDLDFFRQALRHVRTRQQMATEPGGQLSTKSSKR